MNNFNPKTLNSNPTPKPTAPTQSPTQSPPKPTRPLRTITPTDTFPCFNCYDEEQARVRCGVCHGMGFLRGDHPMVVFVDDFLGKNLGVEMEGIGGVVGEGVGGVDGIGGSSQVSDDDNNFFPGKQMLNTRKQSRSALQSYRTTEPAPQSLLKSLRPQKPRQRVHQNYQCNECNCNPIVGERIHCLQCEDYDLCEKCYKAGHYTQPHRARHQIEVVVLNEPEVIMRSFVTRFARKK